MLLNNVFCTIVIGTAPCRHIFASCRSFKGFALSLNTIDICKIGFSSQTFDSRCASSVSRVTQVKSPKRSAIEKRLVVTFNSSMAMSTDQTQSSEPFLAKAPTTDQGPDTVTMFKGQGEGDESEKSELTESSCKKKDVNFINRENHGQENKTENNPCDVQLLSKRAQKKLLRKEKLKELRKAKRGPNSKNSSPGFDKEIFEETDYYLQNGLRKVYPYYFTFSTYAKERWYGRSIQDVFENEFRVDMPDNFRASVRKGNMKVNGEVIGLDFKLKNGDLIEHLIHRHENPVCGKPIEIIEDTPELVVINKPSSIPCHPCGKFRFNSIVFIMGKDYGYANLRNIYRLDRLTSGVLIMGKTTKKTKELEDQVLHRHVQKEYVARVIGEFPEEKFVVDQPLGCLSNKLTLWQVQPGGKPSQTAFERIHYNGQTSLVRCFPVTGRTHQIRVHLQYLGHPIVNDPYYNSPSWGPLRGKGGHCDLPHDELCKRIMQEHNVGLWCEDGGTSTNVDEPKNSNGEFPGKQHEKESQLVNNSTDDSSTLPFASLPKKLKLSREPEQVRDFDTTNSRGNGEELVAESQKKTLSDTVEDLPSNEDKKVADEVLRKESRKTQLLKEFDPARLTVDPSCESCCLKYIDPKPTDLILYLHACKYKGPTWEYSARMPDWAAEDWKEPEEYNKYIYNDG